MCHRNCRLFCWSLIVILLTVVLAACQNDDVPDVVVRVEETAVSTSTAQPGFIATPTATPSSTPMLTKTAVPTNTNTPRPTRFPELLLTPDASPSDVAAYHLITWSAEHAHNLAILMEGYHEVMWNYFGYPTTIETYNWSFLPAYYPYAEAQLLFPNDARYELWQWEEIKKF